MSILTDLTPELLDAIEDSPALAVIVDMGHSYLEVEPSYPAVSTTVASITEVVVNPATMALLNLPAPVVAFIEKYDGPAAAALTEAFMAILMDPERVERRKGRRATRRAKVRAWLDQATFNIGRRRAARQERRQERRDGRRDED